MRVLVLTGLLFSVSAHAIPETDFLRVMGSTVIPYIRTHLERATFRSFDGAPISYGLLRVENPKGTVVVSPGRTEHIPGYTEIIYDLAQAGYSVAIIDHRGQGHSYRPAPWSDVGHVQFFNDYVSDFREFMDHVVLPLMPGPRYLLASSMGSAISALYLMDHSGAFRATSMVVPMSQVSTGPLPAFFAATATRLFLGKHGSDYAPFFRPYNFNQTYGPDNRYTHSKVRFDVDVDFVRADHSLAVGGPSVRWVFETLRATSQARKSADRIQTPLLIFQAGQDYVVKSKAQTKFCQKSRNCELITYSTGFHGLLLETDDIRTDLLNRTLDFFARH